jgi:hypothetical protein
MAEFHARENESAGNYDAKRDVKIKIGREQFNITAKTAKEFDDYMTETIDDTGDGRAGRTGMRRKEVEIKAEKEDKKPAKKAKKPRKRDETGPRTTPLYRSQREEQEEEIQEKKGIQREDEGWQLL